MHIDNSTLTGQIMSLNKSPRNSYLYAGSYGESIYKLDLRLISKPNIPATLRAKVRSKNNVKLTWKDTSMNEQGFIIERWKKGTPNWLKIATTNPNVKSFMDKELGYNTLYKYRIKSFNILGESAFSKKAKAKTKKKKR